MKITNVALYSDKAAFSFHIKSSSKNSQIFLMFSFSNLSHFFFQFELLPINVALQTAEPPFMLSIGTEDEMEQCFDDLCTAQSLVDEYQHRMEEDEEDDNDEVVSDFEVELTQVMRRFKDAIPVMASSSGKDQVDAALESYQTALLKEKPTPGKFCKKWKKILKDKVGCYLNDKLHLPQTWT